MDSIYAIMIYVRLFTSSILDGITRGNRIGNDIGLHHCLNPVAFENRRSLKSNKSDL